MPKQFRGSYTVTITPFTADGKKIDIAAWKRFVDWQIKLGVPGIIILGTTGEFLTVSDEERRLFVETTVKHVRGPHACAGRHHERLHAACGALQPRGGGAGRRRAHDHPALLLHPDRRRDLQLLQGDLREGLDSHHALQQSLHLERRHVGQAGGAADQGLRAGPLHQGGEHGRGAASTTSSRRRRAS